MMRIRISIAYLLLPVLCLLTNKLLSQSESKLSDSADEGKGIFFVHGLSWADVLQKAKAEEKNIFVDCYATWCVPCKLMESEIFTNDSIGIFMSRNFISVRLQMDSTKNDDADVQRWYVFSLIIGLQNHINLYPSYLFFSPDGEPLHKDVGFKDKIEFLAMGRAAMDPAQQYYRLVAAYEKGQMKYSTMPALARAARNSQEDSLSLHIAADYMQHYLLSVGTDSLWTRDNIHFIESFWRVLNSDDQLFALYLADKDRIDSVIGEVGYADNLIDKMIYRDQVKTVTAKALAGHFEPHWRTMKESIEKKYGKRYGEKNVVRGQVEFYRDSKQWSKYATSFIRQMEESGIDEWAPGSRTAMAMNNDAFEIFKYSKEQNELKKALIWTDRALAMEEKPNAQDLDTRANLLYKMGKKQEALILEEKSHSMDPSDEEIAANYQKMKNGLPTWIE